MCRWRPVVCDTHAQTPMRNLGHRVHPAYACDSQVQHATAPRRCECSSLDMHGLTVHVHVRRRWPRCTRTAKLRSAACCSGNISGPCSASRCCSPCTSMSSRAVSAHTCSVLGLLYGAQGQRLRNVPSSCVLPNGSFALISSLADRLRVRLTMTCASGLTACATVRKDGQQTALGE